MPLQLRFAGPVLVEWEVRGIVQCLVQVVIQAPVILAARVNQRQQFLPYLAFLPGLGFDLCGHGKRFSFHEGQSLRHRTLAGNEDLANTGRQGDRTQVLRDHKTSADRWSKSYVWASHLRLCKLHNTSYLHDPHRSTSIPPPFPLHAPTLEGAWLAGWSPLISPSIDPYSGLAIGRRCS